VSDLGLPHPPAPSPCNGEGENTAVQVPSPRVERGFRGEVKHHFGQSQRRVRPTLIFILLALLAATVPAAQRGPARAQEAGRLDVFAGFDAETGTSRIYFLDALSGLSTVVNVENGHHFTLVGDYVLYEKLYTGAIMRANFDGTQEPHPFIRHGIDTQQIDWVVSPDRQALAWVQTNTAGISEAFVARADGRGLRQLPISTPDAPLTLAPLMLTNNLSQFFYDAAHTPDTLFPVYEHMALYSITQEQFYPLPDEPNCPCGAAVSVDGRIFARLEASRGGSGPFALHLWDLPTGAATYVPAPTDLPYRLGGDLLLNDKGTLAVYGVAAGVGSAENNLPESYALVLVDLVSQQQSLILQSGPERYLPQQFIDDDGALLLTSASGTYKLDLATRDLRHVSDAVYLGTITLVAGGT
jgi:hypothetical protein